MSLGINDTFTFGKFKNMRVAEVLISDAEYCCWLRETRRRSNQPRPFDDNVNTMLDNIILSSKVLHKKYSVGNANIVNKTDLKEVIAKQIAHQAAIADMDTSRQTTYTNEWGAW